MWSGYDSVQMFGTSIPDRRVFPRTPLMVQTFGIDLGESVRNIRADVRLSNWGETLKRNPGTKKTNPEPSCTEATQHCS